MDNASGLLSTLGIIACVGGLLLVGAIFLIFRALRGNRDRTPDRMPGTYGEQRPDLVERGHERPTYDSRRVESSGGIGGGPAAPRQDRDRDDSPFGFGGADRDQRSGGPLRDRDRDEPRGGFGSASSFNEPDRDRGRDEPPLRRPRRDDDDDDVRSRGGFGG